MNFSICRTKGKSLTMSLSIAMILLTIPILMGADFWEKKEWTKWNERECLKMLQNSPWAKLYEVSGRSGGDTLDGEIPSIKYTVKFNSALPVRQATIRFSQIQYKYDKLPDEQKQQFDENANQYLAARFPDMVVISIDYSTNVREQQIPLNNYWEIKTTEHLQNTTYLYGANDVKVPLSQYVPGKTSFQFIFPRQVDGKPLVTPEDKSLKLEFEVPSIGGMGGETALIEFKVKDMVLYDEVIL